MNYAHPTPSRHAELVSASTDQQCQPLRVEKWTLKQVQGDGEVSEPRGDKDMFTVAEALGTAI